MSETKQAIEELVKIMVGKGYELEKAIQCVNDVLDARKVAREKYLQEYIGKRIKAKFNGLLFEVIVKDIKIDDNGKTHFQVTPLNGSKCVWIDKFSLN